MDYVIIWFGLWALLWAVYFMLDGFDFGAGMLLNFLGRNTDEKRVIINTIGPVWDGNEVWLITAGGATFAAFPTAYALMFSYLYSALLLILFSLIVRGVSIEFRGKNEHPAWQRGWDLAISLGSFLPSLLFGVAFGNIFRGLPMDADGYHGTLLSLLNPYGILTGLLFLALFIVHGSLWLSYRAAGDLGERSAALSGRAWYGLASIFLVFVVASGFSTGLYDNYLAAPAWLIVPAAAAAAVACIKVFSLRGEFVKAFISSCAAVVCIVFSGIIGLYPKLIPSSIDPAYSLTLSNSASSPYTLKIMTVVAAVFVPIVVAYQVWLYRIFSQRISTEDIRQDPDAY